jgi:hypothetical protein
MKYKTSIPLLLLFLFSILVITCKKEDTSKSTCVDGIQNQGETGVDCGGPCPACNSTVTTATVVTSAATSITGSSAESGGIITSTGGGAVTTAGVCWSTASNPSVADAHTTDYPFPDSFTSTLTDLTFNTTYYVRAYAINSAGISYGNEITFTTTSTVAIGETFGGGIVFYVDGTQMHGYVCAASNQGTSVQWGCYGTSVSGATGLTVGTGQANTAAIVASGCAGSSYAANICSNLVLNGYSDWFLPSRDELTLMATNLASQGLGNFAPSYYWSSSQYSTTYAYAVAFASGSSYTNYKDGNQYVRAIRAF